MTEGKKMEKNYSNKVLKSESAKEETAPAPAKVLICVADCEAPGFGSWKHGEKITDPALVARFDSNPNFKEEGKEATQP